jgi:hypothetical protein
MASHRPSGSPRLRGFPAALRIPPGDRLFHVGLVLALAAVEWYARTTTTDAGDLPGVAALVLLGLAVRHRHRRGALPWVEALGRARRRVDAAVRSQVASLGIDLRGAPPVPRSFPPLLGKGVALLAGIAVLLALLPSLDPASLRAGVRAVSGTAWLVLLGGCWALFGAGSLYLLFMTCALTHDELVRSHAGPGPRPRGREALCLAGWTFFVLAACSLLPPWASLAVLVACLLVAVAALGLPGGPDVSLLWKTPGEGGRLLSASWRTHTLAATALLGLLLADVALFFLCTRLRLAPDLRPDHRAAAVASALPLTSGLAVLFTWCGAAALATWCHLALRTALLARLRDPARPRPVPVFVADPLPAAARDRVRDALEGAGFRVRFAPGRPGPVDAVVSLAADGPVPAGSIPIDPRALASPETRRRLARRHEIRCRRALLRGLESLFRRAAGREFRRGAGFWVAPWHWFCIGLSRDEDERSVEWKEGTFFLETVGPAYHRHFPREALFHAHRVMADLQVDLVFVEDGVGFRRFARVLRMAFEVHDMLGAKGRAQERHFTGLPGVRVLIHEYTMEEPLRARRKGYPEPDYETVGRARILHVFRDRGEDESPVDAPRDRSGVPVPA